MKRQDDFQFLKPIRTSALLSVQQIRKTFSTSANPSDNGDLNSERSAKIKALLSNPRSVTYSQTRLKDFFQPTGTPVLVSHGRLPSLSHQSTSDIPALIQADDNSQLDPILDPSSFIQSAPTSPTQSRTTVSMKGAGKKPKQDKKESMTAAVMDSAFSMKSKPKQTSSLSVNIVPATLILGPPIKAASVTDAGTTETVTPTAAAAAAQAVETTVSATQPPPPTLHLQVSSKCTRMDHSRMNIR